MKILLIHNFYQSHAPSGEDSVFRNEIKLLKDHGHEIYTYTRENDDFKKMNQFERLTSIISGLFWSPKSYFDLKKIISDLRPDVAHIHNLFYLLSPSIYDALNSEKIPVVHTLHNYRLFCSGALLLRNGKACEKCLGKTPILGILYGCFRNHLNTLPIGLSLAFHKAINTWNRKVDIFIALTQFAKDVYIRGGIREDKIFVKPNFLPKPPVVNYYDGSYALFVGRISKEKGIQTLVKAWEAIKFPLKVVGSGPLLNNLKKKIVQKEVYIEFLGKKPFEEVMDILKSALFLVIPSEWYEAFPMVIREAFACGKPVLASNLGSLAEIVEDGKTGLHFETGNAEDLASKAKILIENPQIAIEMGKNARKEFDEKYNEDVNYKILMDIYQKAIETRKNKR